MTWLQCEPLVSSRPEVGYKQFILNTQVDGQEGDCLAGIGEGPGRSEHWPSALQHSSAQLAILGARDNWDTNKRPGTSGIQIRGQGQLGYKQEAVAGCCDDVMS